MCLKCFQRPFFFFQLILQIQWNNHSESWSYPSGLFWRINWKRLKFTKPHGRWTTSPLQQRISCNYRKELQSQLVPLLPAVLVPQKRGKPKLPTTASHVKWQHILYCNVQPTQALKRWKLPLASYCSLQLTFCICRACRTGEQRKQHSSFFKMEKITFQSNNLHQEEQRQQRNRSGGRAGNCTVHSEQISTGAPVSQLL